MNLHYANWDCKSHAFESTFFTENAFHTRIHAIFVFVYNFVFVHNNENQGLGCDIGHFHPVLLYFELYFCMEWFIVLSSYVMTQGF